MLRSAGLRTARVDIRSLPLEALASADLGNLEIQGAVNLVASSEAVVVATPIYKAAYTGLLKTFLDLLPQNALKGKIVLPIATGGSRAHLLALDYALKPVLAALGAKVFASSVYFHDQAIRLDDASACIDDGDRQRLEASVAELIQAVAPHRASAVV